MMDSTGKAINQTQIQNTQINAGSNLTQIETTLQIPDNANMGEATINAAVYSGSFQNINVPAAENQTAYFTIATNTAPTATPTPTPIFTENSVSLFAWLLVATGIFTFTALFIFFRRKPTTQIGTQMPNLPPTILNPATTAPPLFPTNQQETTQKQPPPSTEIPEKIIDATLVAQVPSIYETLDIPAPESTSPQEQKQKMVNQLTKISSISQRIQTLETELKIEKDQLDIEMSDLNKTLEEQEKAVKNYFDAIRQEIAKLHPQKNNNNHDNATSQNEQSDEKIDEN